MPDNQSNGEIEDFVVNLIPVGDPIWPRAQDYIDNIPEEDRKFKKHKAQKARIHAWLATCEKPRRMGLAIKTGNLDSDVPIAVTFTEWIKRLFSNPHAGSGAQAVS